MPNHANFAASIAIKEKTLQEFLKIFYQANQISHNLNATTPQLTTNLFLDLPQLEFASINNNNLSISLRAWGNVTIAPPGNAAETRAALVNVVVKIPPVISIASSSLSLGVNGSAASLTSYDIQVLGSSPFSAATVAYINSSAFASLLQLGIQLYFSSQSQIAPPVNVAFLGNIVTAQNIVTTSTVLDDVLMIGLDINDSGIATNGNALLLTDTTGDDDIGMFINPVVLPIVLSDVRNEVQQKVDEEEATLNAFNMSIREGSYHFDGNASKTGGSVNFAMDAIPKLIRPGHTEEWDEEYGEHFVITTPNREELWFDIQNVNVDIDRDWWVYLLDAIGALFAGIGTLIVESIVSMIKNNITNGIQLSSNRSLAARVQEFTFNGIPSPVIQLRIDKYECHPEGQFTGLTIRPQFPSAELRGLNSIPIEQVNAATIVYSVILPFGTLQDDPNVRIRWTIRDPATLNVVWTSDRRIVAAGLQVDLDFLKPQMFLISYFRIECRVYRTLGTITEEIFNDYTDLRITDRLDRTHPYVHWDHEPFSPDVEVLPNGAHKILGYNLKHRHSKIHKTSFPGRCLMVSRYSYDVLPVEIPGLDIPYLQYMDQLPFPVDELLAHRDKLCDYCFFGGPTKDVPNP